MANNWRLGFPSIYPLDGKPYELDESKTEGLPALSEQDRMMLRGVYGMYAGLMEPICMFAYRDYIRTQGNKYMRFTSWLSHDDLAPPVPKTVPMPMVESPIVEAYCVPGNDDPNGLDYHVNTDAFIVIGNENKIQLVMCPFKLKTTRKVVFRRHVLNLLNRGMVAGHNYIVEDAIDRYVKEYGDTTPVFTLYVMHDIDMYKDQLSTGIYVQNGGFWVSDSTSIIGGSSVHLTDGVEVLYQYKDLHNKLGPIWVKLGDEYKRLTSSDTGCREGLVVTTKFPDKTVETKWWSLEEIIDNQCPLAASNQLELKNRAEMADTEMSILLRQKEHLLKTAQLEASKAKTDAERLAIELKAKSAEEESRLKVLELQVAEKNLNLSKLELELKAERQRHEAEIAPSQMDIKKEELAIKKQETEVKKSTASIDAMGGVMKTVAAVIGGVVSLIAAVVGIFSFFRR